MTTRRSLASALTAGTAAVLTTLSLTAPGWAAPGADPHSANATITGTVTDGSGHGWPLYAKVEVDGEPNGAVYTDPETGDYSLRSTAGGEKNIVVTPVYPGYRPAERDVFVGAFIDDLNFEVPIDPALCTSPGYQHHYTGALEHFDTTDTPEGWTVVDNMGNGDRWRFDDPGARGNHTGGTGGFAVIDARASAFDAVKDTDLVSPSVDMSDIAEPSVGFDNNFDEFSDSNGSVDVSVDGGQTWESVWTGDSDTDPGPEAVVARMPMAAHQPDVRIRFHYHGKWDNFWQVDTVYVGDRTCDLKPGGLVTGYTRDANTGAPVTGATVSTAAGSIIATSVDPVTDPGLDPGRYWLFAPSGGQIALTATSGRYYRPATQSVTPATDSLTSLDFDLPAGRPALDVTSITDTLTLGDTATVRVPITNDGTAPLTVTSQDQHGGVDPLATMDTGAPVQRIEGTYSPLRTGAVPLSTTAGRPSTQPNTAPWTPVADYPVPIMDNMVSVNEGKVYSVGGTTTVGGGHPLTNGYVYDPATREWSPIADLPEGLQKPAGAFINGEFYVVGGWDATGYGSDDLYIYHPDTDKWTTGAPVPVGFAGSGVGVVDGKMYVVGGCDQLWCGRSDVYVYDPAADTWTEANSYPIPTSWEACGGIGEALYCTGGLWQLTPFTKGYSYDPATDQWTPIADLPVDTWGMGYATVNGTLIVSGGVTQYSHVMTNEGYAYDPTTNTWTPIPNANNALYRGGSACGFYRIGGSERGFSPRPYSELLPGLDACGGPERLAWLPDPEPVTIQPGQTRTLDVTLAADAVAQPGTYTATLVLTDDSPYRIDPITVTLTVDPPSSWGKIAGTVTGANCDGTHPIAGATVQLQGTSAEYTIRTDADGYYQYWLDEAQSPTHVIVAKDGWQPILRQETINAGATTIANYTLNTTRTCAPLTRAPV